MVVLLVTAATTVEGYSRGSFDFTNKAPHLFDRYNSDKSAGIKVAKRGRPPGATTRWRNPNNFAALHAQTLMELWLAGAPVLVVRAMLSSLAGDPEQQALIQACWSRRGNEPRHTVPPKIKRQLCRLAVAHTMELQHDRILRQRAQASYETLRRQGWTDTQIKRMCLSGVPRPLAPLGRPAPSRLPPRGFWPLGGRFLPGIFTSNAAQRRCRFGPAQLGARVA
jgi:hypothetical protein